MLQDARDELERMRGDNPSAAQGRRANRKADSREQLNKKAGLRSSQLGGSRSSKTDLYIDDGDWEEPRPAVLAARLQERRRHQRHDQSTTDTSDAAFETAHEPSTETDDFHTGAEELSDDDDEGAATEIESPAKGATLRASRRPPPLSLSFQDSARAARMSFQSTASTSDDEQDDDLAAHADLTTPTGPRMRLRLSRGNLLAATHGTAARRSRSRQPSEEPAAASSPPASASTQLYSSPPNVGGSSAAGTPQRQSQSLFAELGDDLDDSDDGDDDDMPPHNNILAAVMGPSRQRSLASLGGTPMSAVLPAIRSGAGRSTTAATTTPAPGQSNEVPVAGSRAIVMVDSFTMMDEDQVRRLAEWDASDEPAMPPGGGRKGICPHGRDRGQRRRPPVVVVHLHGHQPPAVVGVLAPLLDGVIRVQRRERPVRPLLGGEARPVPCPAGVHAGRNPHPGAAPGPRLLCRLQRAGRAGCRRPPPPSPCL